MSELSVNQLLAQLRSTAAAAQGGATGVEQAKPAVDFSELLKNSVDKVNEIQQQASSMATAFEVGDPKANLEEVMIALQKANISFQAMTQVRNKLLAAYQEIMNMPV